jgi:hypothetical protein
MKDWMIIVGDRKICHCGGIFSTLSHQSRFLSSIRVIDVSERVMPAGYSSGFFALYAWYLSGFISGWHICAVPD